MTRYLRFGLVLGLLLGIAGLSAIVTMQFAVHRTTVEVPDLQGLSVGAATSRAAALGLDLSVTQRLYSTVLPAGAVLLQSPAGGATVRRGWDVAVAQSLGPRRIAIPDLLGKPEREALLTLRQHGLELGAIAHLPTRSASPGTVLAQDPGPAAEGAEQPSVNLLIAVPAPAEPPAWVMPDETGKPYPEAAASLSKLNLHAESAAGAPPGVRVPLSPATAPGTVLAQTPEAGTRVDASSKIVLWVAQP